MPPPEEPQSGPSSYKPWSKYCTEEYDPVAVGSIDGTDEFPHDRALVRAMNSTYKPSPKAEGDPRHTVFVGRLEHCVDEERVRELFGRCGTVVRCRVVRDVVTGVSRGYAFVEFSRRKYVERALKELHGKTVEGKEILVDEEVGRTLKGWKPRRLGGGFGGRKKSQQLRFGCRDRPWMFPIKGNVVKYGSKNEFHREARQQRELLNAFEFP